MIIDFSLHQHQNCVHANISNLRYFRTLCWLCGQSNAYSARFHLLMLGVTATRFHKTLDLGVTDDRSRVVSLFAKGS